MTLDEFSGKETQNDGYATGFATQHKSVLNFLQAIVLNKDNEDTKDIREILLQQSPRRSKMQITNPNSKTGTYNE